MATIDKKIYSLEATPELVKLTTVTNTYRLEDVVVELEEGEYVDGEPDYVIVKSERERINSSISVKWMDVADISSFTNFVAHVKGLVPAQTKRMNYEITDTFKVIKVENNNVSFDGGTGATYIEDLEIWSTDTWTVPHDANNELGEFFCQDFEDLVNDILANGRDVEKVKTTEEADKEGRVKLIRYYNKMSIDDLTDTIKARVEELLDFETPTTLTTEELAILEA